MTDRLNPRRNARHNSRRQLGVTLIESAVASTIVAIVASTAAPSLSGLKARHQVIGAASIFETDVQLARSAAVTRNMPVRISFGAGVGVGAAAACYIVHTGGADDCTCSASGAAECRADVQVLRSESFVVGRAVTLTSNVRSMVFDPVKGTSTPAGTVRFAGASGAKLHQVVNIMGRVRTCSPAQVLAGYKAC